MRNKVGIAATLILRLLSQGKSEKSQSGPFLKGKRERERRESIPESKPVQMRVSREAHSLWIVPALREFK